MKGKSKAKSENNVRNRVESGDKERRNFLAF